VAGREKKREKGKKDDVIWPASRLLNRNGCGDWPSYGAFALAIGVPSCLLS
jgi:hypothetical protein